MKTLLKNLFRTRRGRARRKATRFTPQIESLEGRRMMAADFCLTPGTANEDLIDDVTVDGEQIICVRGTDDADVITLEYDRDSNGNINYNQVRATVYALQGWDIVELDSDDESLNNVDRIEIRGFGGDDMIVNMTDLAIPTLMFGGEGQDELFAGGGDDIMDGGADNDKFFFRHAYESVYFNPQFNPDYDGSAVDYYFANLGHDRVIEEVGGGEDRMDFRELESALTLDMANANAQTAVTNILNLTLQNAAGQLSEVENVRGTDFGDVIEGNELDNDIYGYRGNDTLVGRGGNDFLLGSLGDDTLEGQAGDDRLYGSSDDDTYVFNNLEVSDLGKDTIREYSNDGRDTLDFSAMQLDQYLMGINLDLAIAGVQDVDYGVYSPFALELELSSTSSKIEDVKATDGYDTVKGNELDNHIQTFGLGDGLEGRGGDDTLEGGSYNDTYYFKNPDGSNLGHDTVIEQSNADTDQLHFYNMDRAVIVNLASTTTQTVASGVLQLTLNSSTGIENVAGSQYGDTIYGNSRNNSILGYDGDDWIYGYAGEDSLSGLNGDDHLFGGKDADTLNGGNQNDYLYGEQGLDTLYGGDGADYLNGDYANTNLTDGFQDELFGYSRYNNNDYDTDTFVLHWRRFFNAFGYLFTIPMNEETLAGFKSGEDVVQNVIHWW